MHDGEKLVTKYSHFYVFASFIIFSDTGLASHMLDHPYLDCKTKNKRVSQNCKKAKFLSQQLDNLIVKEAKKNNFPHTDVSSLEGSDKMYDLQMKFIQRGQRSYNQKRKRAGKRPINFKMLETSILRSFDKDELPLAKKLVKRNKLRALKKQKRPGLLEAAIEFIMGKSRPKAPPAFSTKKFNQVISGRLNNEPVLEETTEFEMPQQEIKQSEELVKTKVANVSTRKTRFKYADVAIEKNTDRSIWKIISSRYLKKIVNGRFQDDTYIE